MKERKRVELVFYKYTQCSLVYAFVYIHKEILKYFLTDAMEGSTNCVLISRIFILGQRMLQQHMSGRHVLETKKARYSEL